MPLKRPLGHHGILDRLEGFVRELADGGAPLLHHAYLMAGRPGIGKFAVARWWASALKCERPAECKGECHSCRLVVGGVHPDVAIIDRAGSERTAGIDTNEEGAEGRRSIGIKAARALIHKMSLKPVQRGPRIGVVAEADALTVDAQNALLKLLEEPPGFTVLILVADNPATLLPTVRSRCQVLRFGALEETDIARVLEDSGIDAEEARAAAAVARGSVGRALVYDSDGLEDRESLIVAYQNAIAANGPAEDLVSELASRKDDGYGLDVLLEWQLRKVEASLGNDPPEPSDALEGWLATARRTDTRKLLAGAQRIERTMASIARNVNAKIAIRDLLLNIED